MIKRLITIIAIPFITLFSAGMVARAIGSRAENPLKALGFDVCDGSPCFLGVVAGVTSLEEAKYLLLSKGATLNYEETAGTAGANFWYDPTSTIRFSIDLNVEPGTGQSDKIGALIIRSSLTMSTPLAGVYMADAIQLYSAPSCMVEIWGGTIFIGAFNSSGNSMLMSEPLNTIGFTGDDGLYSLCQYGIRWRGFMSLDSYHKIYTRLPSYTP